MSMMKLRDLVEWMKARLAEPSTLSSIAALAAMAGYKVDMGALQTLFSAMTLVFGFLGVIIKETAK